jgi:hypothetical protein
MRIILPALLAPLALFLAACGAGAPTAGGTSTGDEPPPARSEPDPARLYQANTTVLEDRTHGPMLCLSGMLESFPPQCGTTPITGWDWRAVEGEEKAGGTTWGSFHVVGRYDGETFSVTRVGPYEDDPAAQAESDLTSPCPEPEGGWTGTDDATQEDDNAALAYARSQPDYVSSWVTHLDPAAAEFGPVVFNAVFTGDRKRHEAKIREVWTGPLCVVERSVPTASELQRIRREVEAGLDDLGLQMTWSQGPGVEPVVEIGVVVDPDGKAQAVLDARYGPGLIRLVPALKPVF